MTTLYLAPAGTPFGADGGWTEMGYITDEIDFGTPTTYENPEEWSRPIETLRSFSGSMSFELLSPAFDVLRKSMLGLAARLRAVEKRDRKIRRRLDRELATVDPAISALHADYHRKTRHRNRKRR